MAKKLEYKPSKLVFSKGCFQDQRELRHLQDAHQLYFIQNVHLFTDKSTLRSLNNKLQILKHSRQSFFVL